MKSIIDITGEKFGKLTAIKYVGNRQWLFKCDCGNTKVITTCAVVGKRVKSCGCLHLERCRSGLNQRRHGHTVGGRRSPEHSVWTDILKRTTNKNHKFYNRYGGRGIKVCERWLKFENFLSDMGKRPKGLTIDRIDNDCDYTKSNCKWSTRKEQARNRKTTKHITYKGQKKSLAEWCEIYKLPYARVFARLNKLHWSIEAALS